MSEGPLKPESPKDRLEHQGLIIEEVEDTPELHAPLSFEEFAEYPPDAQLKLQTGLNFVQEYLRLPIIKDNFGRNHHARHAWKMTLPPELLSYYENSKLTGNNITRLISSLNLIVGAIESGEAETYTPIESKVLDMCEEVIKKAEDYNQMDAEDRLVVVRELDEFCKELTALMTNTER